MGSKHKSRPGASPAAGQSPRFEVDRLIAKGWYKDAVKQAKICHRDHPNPEHHRLLEQAYLLRAQELLDGGMPTAAQEVASHLLDFGITDPSLNEPAASLLIAVGLDRQALALQGKLETPEAIDRLNRKAADQAVLHPERKSESSPEILDGARRIRLALEALEAGDEPKALENLRDLSRTSPFADWRLFVRGLAAFRRGDDSDARANWERLDPARSAVRIARPLIEVMGSGLLNGSISPKVEGLERWALSEPILSPLRNLAEFVAQGLWPEAVRKLGPLRLAIRRVDPALALRLTEALYSPLLHEATELDLNEAKKLLSGFTKASEPLPIDPRWNRIWAMAWDGPQGYPTEAEPYWRRYIEDLETVAAIRPEERSKARGLVLAHLGQEWAALALDLDEDENDDDDLYDEDIKEARRRAVACLEESLRFLPSKRETYQSLIDFYDNEGGPDRAAEVARRLLKAIPDDLEVLRHLEEYEMDRENPALALEYCLQARKLKPLDLEILFREYRCRVALARQHATHGRWDEGRLELETAARLNPEVGRSFSFAVRRACFEIKAGCPEAARTILQDAQESLPEASPLWLAMAIETRRFQLPQPEIDRYESLWSKASSAKVRSETAGALAGLLVDYLVGQVAYPGRDEHIEQVTGYLARATRLKYTHDNLFQICDFLAQVPGQEPLLQKFVKRGFTLFPNHPQYPMLMGAIEMQKGPFRANIVQARRHYEAALKLAEASDQSDPKIIGMIPAIKKVLSSLNELTAGPLGLPFPFPFPTGKDAPDPDEIMKAFQKMMGGSDPFEEDDIGGKSAPAPPRRKGRKS
jgi:hypothetical protein